MQLIIQKRQKTCQTYVIRHFYSKKRCEDVGRDQDLLYFCGIKKKNNYVHGNDNIYEKQARD